MVTDTRIFVNIFENIVDSMRATGNITSSTEVSTTYTIITTNNLNEGDSISINDINYIITSVTASQFNITAITGIDFTGEEWKALAPYCIYGHPREIAGRLSLKDQSDIDKFRKFPLIVLITDLKEQHGIEPRNVDYIVQNPKIVIVTNTISTYTSSERLEATFKPTLLPLYYQLIEKIKDYQYIVSEYNLIKHDKYDRYSWGSESVYGNQGLIFNDFLDAVEINIDTIKVSVRYNTCL